MEEEKFTGDGLNLVNGVSEQTEAPSSSLVRVVISVFLLCLLLRFLLFSAASETHGGLKCWKCSTLHTRLPLPPFFTGSKEWFYSPFNKPTSVFTMQMDSELEVVLTDKHKQDFNRLPSADKRNVLTFCRQNCPTDVLMFQLHKPKSEFHILHNL